MISLGAFLVAVLVASWALTGMLVRWSPRFGLLDRPGARSSHTVVTPRGGGLAIVIVAVVALGVAGGVGIIDDPLVVALGGGGLLVAAIGFVDDLVGGVRPWVRLVVHFAAVAWAIFWLGGLPPMQVGERTIEFGWVGTAVAAVAMMWVVNLFNFMDGIDGLASTEAIFVSAAGALLAFVNGSSTVPLIGCVVAMTTGGFMLWNWPPARIFMGDVGSGFLGFVLATLALAAMRESPVAGYAYLTLGGVFFVDATVVGSPGTELEFAL